MRKLVSLFLIFTFMFSCCVPTYATELVNLTPEPVTVEETEPEATPEPTAEPEATPEPEISPTATPEASESTDTTEDETEPEPSTEPTAEPSEEPEPEATPEPSEEPEPSTEPTPEPTPEPSEEPTTETEIPTVNLSDESISAVAEAVSSSGSSVTNKDGLVYEVPLEVVGDWGSYEYKCAYVSGYYTYWFLSEEPFTYGNDFIRATSMKLVSYFKGSYQRTETPSKYYSLSGGSFVWSNHDIMEYNATSVYYAADIEQPITASVISFDTGFDDYTIESQSSDSFVLPTAEYEGYRFDGWFLDEARTQPYTADYTFTGNTTLYAKFSKIHTITFVTGLEHYEIDPVQIVDGEAYSIPTFVYDGYSFVAAYTDEDKTVQFIDGSTITEDITLYLRFEAVQYDYGRLMTEQLARLESVIYLQMAQNVIMALVIIAFYFFRKRDGLGI